MNPTTEQPPPPPPPPLQPHRSSFSCDRHPTEQFTGFCPSCLCERLSTLDQSSSAAASSSSRRPSNASTASAALKAIFRVPTSSIPPDNNTTTNNKTRPKPSFFPELRRTKSFSASKNEGFSGVFEPQRKSCDVRGRNTLWSLFNLDDERKSSVSKTDCSVIEIDNNRKSVEETVFESKEEEDYEIENDDVEEENENDNDNDNNNNDENDSNLLNVEIVKENDEIEEIEEIKTMKDHIDLDSGVVKKPSSGFWSAASVFSKKWQNWRRKQKLKKMNPGGNSAALPVEKPISRQFRETQSEIADYGFGRRSCDTDPRFSLDAGRISFDDPRYSFDEPRASWDGYLIGRSFPRLPPMLSVVEDAPVVQIPRSDAQIPLEEPLNCVNGEEMVPGGSAQTREYYSDSSSRRRKSLDRSSSIRKTAAAVVAEIDEMKLVSNAKVSPATIDYFHGGTTKVLVGERDLRDSNSNSLRDDCSETFELGFRDNASVVGNGGEQKGSKKSKRWSKAWNIWGFIHRRSGGNKDEDEERYSRGNGVERSFSESWQELRRESNGEVRGGGFNRKVLRSNSSVSWRNSYNNGGSFGSVRKSSVETNGHGKKRRDEFVLERNRSARYSPNDIDNGLLRFYLTPMRSSSRRGGLGKMNKPNNSHSITRSLLRLY